MGDSCSKADHARDSHDDADNGSPPPNHYANDDNGNGSGKKSKSSLKRPRNNNNKNNNNRNQQLQQQHQSQRRSLFRVGSILQRLPQRGPFSQSFKSSASQRTQQTEQLHIESPKTRASNYNHVHDAVAMNFQEAANIGGGIWTRETPPGVVGLRNLGNTCFLNASLQCLSATIPLTDYFLGYNYRSEINKTNFLGTGGKLVTAYAELIKAMWLGSSGSGSGNNTGDSRFSNINTSISSSVIKPVSFKSQLDQFCPQFVGTAQHDAQELLSFLLDGIHEDLNRIHKKPYIQDRDCDGSNDEQDAIEAWKNYLLRDKSLVVDIFQGQLKSTCQCLTCGHTNIRFEPFMYLSLPISDTCRSLSDCLDLYLAQERLTGENQWYCETCCCHRDATKKTDLWILPPILIVHLKRFRVNMLGQRGSKRDEAIDYPVEKWDLSAAVKSRGSEYPLYDLYAVSNHVGGLSGGHYTAYSLNRFDEQWYEYNDSNSRRVDPNTLRRNQSSAYLLFYNRSEEQRSSSGSGSLDAARRQPLIRRQSVSRPDLWPHTQVQERNQFREYSRVSVRHNFPLPLSLDEKQSEEEAVNMVIEGDDYGEDVTQEI